MRSGRRLAFDDRFQTDTQPREPDAAVGAEELEVVEPFRRQVIGADDNAVDRRRLDEHGKRRVAAEHRIALHANAGLARIVVDETEDSCVLSAAREELANHQPTAVAGAVDDDPMPRLTLALEKLSDDPER